MVTNDQNPLVFILIQTLSMFAWTSAVSNPISQLAALRERKYAYLDP